MDLISTTTRTDQLELVVNSTMVSSSSSGHMQPVISRYENQKRRDWTTFGQYLRNHRPPLTLSRCSGAHVLEFLRYLDQFGKTKVHIEPCPYFGDPNPPAPCPCPLRQAWGSLDALIGRLRAAYEEHGGVPESNPFGDRAVRLFLREVRASQSRARGVSYEKKKKRKRNVPLLHDDQGSTLSAGVINNHHHHQEFYGGVSVVNGGNYDHGLKYEPIDD